MVTIGLLLVTAAIILFFMAVSVFSERDEREQIEFEKECREVSEEVMEMMKELGGDEED